MNTEHSLPQSQWKEFEGQSTFTFPDRNVHAMQYIADYRKKHQFPYPRTVCLLGSGVVEPFVMAALPQLSNTDIIAVEINPDLIKMGEEIKSGGAVPWSAIAEKSSNPGRINRDLLVPERVSRSLSVLKKIGCMDNLGEGFKQSQMQVSDRVRNRVHFIHGDALSALKQGKVGSPDIIGDFFLQVNLNKIPELVNGKYVSDMTKHALKALDPNGFYLVGDTGLNLPRTLGHFNNTTEGVLNFGSLALVVNISGEFHTQHYLLASKIPYLPCMGELADTAQQNVSRLINVSAYKRNTTLSGLTHVLEKDRANLALINMPGRGVAWNTEIRKLSGHAPQNGDMASPTIIFPGQKS